MIKLVVNDLICKNHITDSFYVANIQTLRDKICEWRTLLPTVQPFYAMKCHPDPKMMKVMIESGFGFDAASKNELKLAIELGAVKENIIYAHPVKMVGDLQIAYKHGIKYTTFDSISELEKIKAYAPHMDCLIRLKVDNPTARIQLGLKYGALENEYKPLIDYAKHLNINIIGTAFHVGSASKDAQVFDDGLNFSNEVLNYARKCGYSPQIVDIGGGFTGSTFKSCAEVINISIKKYGLEGMRLIAEPGRYFAENVFSFYTPIIGQRIRGDKREYWIADGLYGSFNCILYDAQTPIYEVVRNPLSVSHDIFHSCTTNDETFESMVYGSTCDSADTLGLVQLPVLQNGDFIKIPDFGAYTKAGAMDFNGINMSNPRMFYI